MQERFNKDLEETKKNQYIMNNAINEIKNTLEATNRRSKEKAREFQKNIYFCFIDYAKAFDCVDHNQLWKILKEMGIPDT